MFGLSGTLTTIDNKALSTSTTSSQQLCLLRTHTHATEHRSHTDTRRQAHMQLKRIRKRRGLRARNERRNFSIRQSNMRRHLSAAKCIFGFCSSLLFCRLSLSHSLHQVLKVKSKMIFKSSLFVTNESQAERRILLMEQNIAGNGADGF